MVKDFIKQIIPKPIRRKMRWVYDLLLDLLDWLTGKRDQLTPPRRMIFIGDGDFRKIGEEFFHYFIELGGLKPKERVLEIGCGIGRMAVPLSGYLKAGGSYEGFDIVADGIKWCQRKITPRFPNFQFKLVDVFNQAYNPKGKFKASEYAFPYADESFDFIFLTSVFTHMLPPDLEHYFSELTRVLRRGGKCFITYFLLNEESKKLIGEGRSTLEFKSGGSGYYTIDRNTPEAAVAYEENMIKGLYHKYQLIIINPVHYGSWCARKKYLSYQDIVIAGKKGI